MAKQRCLACGARLCNAVEESIHPFPSKYPLRQQWIDFLKEPYPHLRVRVVEGQGICDKHFAKDAFQADSAGSLTLKKGAVPTIHVDGESVKSDNSKSKASADTMKTASGENLIGSVTNSTVSSEEKKSSEEMLSDTAITLQNKDAPIAPALRNEPSASTRCSPLSQMLNKISQWKESDDHLQEERTKTLLPATEREKCLAGTTRKRSRKPEKHQLKHVRRDSVPKEAAHDPPSVFAIAEQNTPFVKSEPSSSIEEQMPFPEIPPDLQQPSEEEVLIKKELEEEGQESSSTVAESQPASFISREKPVITPVMKEEFNEVTLSPHNTSPEPAPEPKIVNIRSVGVENSNGLPQIAQPRIIPVVNYCVPSSSHANGTLATQLMKRKRDRYFQHIFTSLYDMQKAGRLCDLTFCIGLGDGDKPTRIPDIKVHKFVFAAMSDRIRTLRGDVFILNPTHTYVSLLSVVEFVYSGTIKNIHKLATSVILQICETALTLDILNCLTCIRMQRPDVNRSKLFQSLISQHLSHFSLSQPEIQQGQTIPRGRSESDMCDDETTSQITSGVPRPTAAGGGNVEVFVYCDMSDTTDTSDDEWGKAPRKKRKYRRSRATNGKKENANRVKIKPGEILVPGPVP